MQPSDKSIIRQNIITFPELGFNYWAINKNATSSMLHYFADQIGIRAPITNSDQQAKVMLKHLNRYIGQDEAYNNGLKNIVIVRNPFKRFESCFRMFKFPVNDIQRKASRKANFDRTWNSQDFLLSIKKQWDFRSKRGNKHYWKQTWFVPDLDKIDHVIKLENLVDTWPLEMKIPTIHFNRTDKKRTSRPWDYNKDLLFHLYKDDFSAFGYKHRIGEYD